jgi:hypothetical protein
LSDHTERAELSEHTERAELSDDTSVHMQRSELPNDSRYDLLRPELPDVSTRHVRRAEVSNPERHDLSLSLHANRTELPTHTLASNLPAANRGRPGMPHASRQNMRVALPPAVSALPTEPETPLPSPEWRRNLAFE